MACRELDLEAVPDHALEIGADVEAADFSHNAIACIPETFGSFTNLKTLDFSWNHLVSSGLDQSLFPFPSRMTLSNQVCFL